MKKPPFVLRLLLRIVSFVLSACLFVATISTIFIADVRAITDKDTLKNIVSDLMFAADEARSVPADTPQAAAFRHVRLQNVPVEEEMSQNVSLVTKWIYNFLQEKLGEEHNLSYDHVDALLEDSTIKDFLSDKIAGVLSDAITGETTISITNEEIVALITENRDAIEKHLGVSLTDEKMQTLSNWVEESGLTEKLSQEGILGILGQEGGTEPLHTGFASVKHVFDAFSGKETLHLPTIVEAARFMISDTVMMAAIGLSFLLLGLLVIVNLIQLPKGLMAGGLTLLSAGGLMLIPAILSSTVADLLPGITGMLIKHLLNATMPAALVTVVLAVALIVGSIVLKILLPKRKSFA